MNPASVPGSPAAAPSEADRMPPAPLALSLPAGASPEEVAALVAVLLAVMPGVLVGAV